MASFLGSESSSRTDAQAQTAGANSTLRSVRTGGGTIGTLQEQGAVSGGIRDQRKDQTGAFIAGKGSTVTINQGLSQDAFNAALARLDNDESESDNAQFTDLFNKLLDSNAALAETKQQEGQPFALTNRTILYLVVAVASAIALIFIFRRRK